MGWAPRDMVASFSVSPMVRSSYWDNSPSPLRLWLLPTSDSAIHKVSASHHRFLSQFQQSRVPEYLQCQIVEMMLISVNTFTIKVRGRGKFPEKKEKKNRKLPFISQHGQIGSHSLKVTIGKMNQVIMTKKEDLPMRCDWVISLNHCYPETTKQVIVVNCREGMGYFVDCRYCLCFMPTKKNPRTHNRS